ncbi:MAG: NAD(P)H-dependent oxidoreductase [Planctomycetota bacterium]
MKILRIDASARRTGSASRALADRAIDLMLEGDPTAEVHRRDLLDGVTLLTEETVGALFTPEGERSDSQRAALRESDLLAAELLAADRIVLAVPIYNFSIPAALKAWCDLVARARVTFRYSADGPVGLATGKRALVIVTSGGTEVGSDIDHATGYVRHFLGFLGITDVDLVCADQTLFDDRAVARAEQELDELLGGTARGR